MELVCHETRDCTGVHDSRERKGSMDRSVENRERGLACVCRGAGSKWGTALLAVSLSLSKKEEGSSCTTIGHIYNVSVRGGGEGGEE